MTQVAQLSKYTKELSEYFSNDGNILLVCHINPDGDAIGSQIALRQYLLSIGKKVEMMSPNYLQEFLKWMDGANDIKNFIKQRDLCKNIIRDADLIIMLDFNKSDRLGEAQDFILASKAKKVLIDHHLDPDNFCDLAISDPSKCSTSELVHELVTLLNGKPYNDKAYAEALYVGIVTDTGNFEHGNYTASTFRTVADLIDSGIDNNRILDQVYNNFSASRMKLQGFALNERMTIIEEYSTAYIYLTREDLANYGYTKGDTEGFVNLPLSIKGIIFSVLFIEKDGFIKLSFRSKGGFPCNEFASNHFSGGGHLNASGGEHKDNLKNTIEYFQNVMRENFNKYINS